MEEDEHAIEQMSEVLRAAQEGVVYRRAKREIWTLLHAIAGTTYKRDALRAMAGSIIAKLSDEGDRIGFGRMLERTDIVRWLRYMSTAPLGFGQNELQLAAHMIERGDHERVGGENGLKEK